MDTRYLWALVAAGVLAGGFLLFQCVVSPEVSFVRGGSWIGAPRPVQPLLERLDGPEPPPARFFREFLLDTDATGVVLHVQALREITGVAVNGAAFAAPALHADNWKRGIALDVSPHLRRGSNRIVVEVRNPSGPPLLRLRVDGLPAPLATDASWMSFSGGGEATPAVPADDTRIYADSRMAPSPWSALRERWLVLVSIFAVCAALAGAWPLVRRHVSPARLPWILAIALTVGWSVLFLVKFRTIPLHAGFDARGHVEYIRLILEHGALPLAPDGWTTYHPPLFYVASAALVRALSPSGAFHIVKTIPFLCGLGTVWVAFALARRVFDGEPTRTAFAVLTAGVLPMNLYLAAYVSNESMHGLLASLTILATAGILLARRSGWRAWIAVGVLLGLALLTKATAVVLAPVVLLFLGLRLRFVERRSWWAAAGRPAVSALCAAAIAGWYYVRNFLHFGTPLPDNGANVLFWQQPGFRSAGYFVRFGDVFENPYFAGFRSFWDGLYGTLWGDGHLGGAASFAGASDWNYEYMSIGYLLAIPASALMLVGLLSNLGASLRREQDEARKLLGAFLTAVVLSALFLIVYYSLRLPYWSTPKAFYGLYASGPLAIGAAVGFATLGELLEEPRRVALRMLFFGWLGTWIAVVGLTFAA